MAIKTTGSFEGKSNKLGYGGRSSQLKAQGVPGGVIGDLARKAQAAPGQKNYHGGKAKKGGGGGSKTHGGGGERYKDSDRGRNS